MREDAAELLRHRFRRDQPLLWRCDCQRALLLSADLERSTSKENRSPLRRRDQG
ncbi:hypothetical protein WCX72_12250 [Sulfurimonas sp. HSL1-6]|uniref:hypothetical protein n=1 Tax=Thiomicrolovo immobilis TaxID=3131935 RepID=UPI0031F85CFD